MRITSHDDVLKEECTVRVGIYPSLSGYYPESDLESESSLGSESGSSLSSWDGELHGIRRWHNGEEEREGLIEIDLMVTLIKA